jgi:trimethylamine--corrinoid protein Co-methyltransferase
VIDGFRRRLPPLRILTDEQIEAVHSGALSTLCGTGVKVEHEESLKLMRDNGCEVDFGKRLVRFPPGLVEECLRRCPSSFRLRARDSEKDVILGGDTTYFKNSVGQMTVDLDSLEPRVPTEKEFLDALRVLDALESVHVLGPYTPYFGYEGVPPVMSIPSTCAAKLKYSGKAQLEGVQKGSEVFCIKMAKAVGSEILGLMNAPSPLTWGSDVVEAAYRFAEADFPVQVASGAVMGGTAPATIAGALVLTTSEILAGITLVQLRSPKPVKVLPGTFSFPMEMRSGLPAFGDIGVSLYQIAFNQIWRGYGLPVYNSASGYCSSKGIDFQAGYEKAIACLLSALSGANLITFHGSVSAELTFHPVQAVLEDDVAGMIGRLVEGIEVSDETLALDLIEKVGPIPGSYIGEAHTRKWWRREQYLPQAADRLSYPEWKEKSKKTCVDYAKERVEKILATHAPESLAPDLGREVNEILEEARRYYEEKGLI